MLIHVHQEKIFRDMIEGLFAESEALSDKQRYGLAQMIASTLCDFIRQNAIHLHESGISLNQETRKSALNLANYVRNFAMERLNSDPTRQNIRIHGFSDRPRDPYAFRVMNVEFD